MPDPLGGWAARGARQRGGAAGGTYAKAKLVKRETKGREEGGTGDKGRQRRRRARGGCDAGQRGESHKHEMGGNTRI